MVYIKEQFFPCKILQNLTSTISAISGISLLLDFTCFEKFNMSSPFKWNGWQLHLCFLANFWKIIEIKNVTCLLHFFPNVSMYRIYSHVGMSRCRYLNMTISGPQSAVTTWTINWNNNQLLPRIVFLGRSRL